MMSKKENEHILSKCRGCGNTGLQRIVSKYDQSFSEMDIGTGAPIFNETKEWFLLECPVCQNISLYRKYWCDGMFDYNGNVVTDDETVFPAKRSFNHVPVDIRNAYEAAINTINVDYSISLVAIRALLEKICKERGTSRKKLAAMLKQMVERNIFPETIDKCSFIIRKMGNAGAHGEDVAVSKTDIMDLIDFIETIMYYIYELPYKIDKMNKKHKATINDSDR